MVITEKRQFFINRYIENRHLRYGKGHASRVIKSHFKIKKTTLTWKNGFDYNFLNAIESQPETTKKSLILPWRIHSFEDDEFSYQQEMSFDLDFFDSSAIGYKITKEELGAVMEDLKEIDNWVPIVKFPTALWIGILSVPVILGVILFVIFSNLGDFQDNIVLVMVLIFVGLLGIFSIFMPCFVLKYNNDRLKKRQQEIKQVLQEWNEKIFETKGVKLIEGKFGAWIEIMFEEEMEGIEDFLEDMKDEIMEDLRDEYEEVAKLHGIEVEGVIPDCGSPGCWQPGVEVQDDKFGLEEKLI